MNPVITQGANFRFIADFGNYDLSVGFTFKFEFRSVDTDTRLVWNDNYVTSFPARLTQGQLEVFVNGVEMGKVLPPGCTFEAVAQYNDNVYRVPVNFTVLPMLVGTPISHSVAPFSYPVSADNYGAPVADLAALAAIPNAGIPQHQRRFVISEGADYFYYQAASSGDVAPDDQVASTGFWNKATSSSSSAQIAANTASIATNASFIRESVVFASDHGAVGDGVANDTVSLNAAITAAATNNKKLVLRTGATYLIDHIDIRNTGSVPVEIDGMYSTLLCSGQAIPPTGTLLYLQNVHAARQWFSLKNLVLDGNDLIDHPFKMHGGSDVSISNVLTKGGLSDGFVLEAEPGYGIYSCNITNLTSVYNAGRGITSVTINGGGSYHNATNVFNNVRSQNNLLEGYHFDYAGGTVVNGRGELNNGHGLSLDNIYSLVWAGGYFEHNHENLAQGGTTNSTADELAILTANTTGFQMFGPRDVGTIDDSAITAIDNKNVIMTRNAGSMTLTASGDLHVGSARVKSTGGVMIGTGTMTANAYGGNDGLKIRAGGNNAITIPSANVEGESTAQFKFLVDGVAQNHSLDIHLGVKQEGGANYTMKVTDHYWEMIEFTNAAAVSVRFPDSATTPLPLHKLITWKQKGAGGLSVTALGAGDTIVYWSGEGVNSPGQEATMSCIQTSLGEFHIMGGVT